jgi:alkylation response protein AidB-like acyl-CoA dehydrogenase
VDFRDTPEEAIFRSELRTWLEANLPADLAGHADIDARHAWNRALFEAGYAGLTWPKEFGGRGLGPGYQAVFFEEEARVQAPGFIGDVGVGMAGPTILHHGTELQKAQHVQPILSAAELWCQGFSEPEAGSDLAGVRTSARLDGGLFIVDGQKVWSTLADRADFCLLLARSDAGSRGHQGLTYLIVDMRSPGIEVRPVRQLTGAAEYAEIFFSGVEVPVANVLGAVGDGWSVAMTTLLHERATLGFALVARLDSTVRRLLSLARDRGATQTQREVIGRAWAELQGLRITAYRSLAALTETGTPGPEGSIIKLNWSEASQRLAALALELLGPDAQLLGDNAPYGGTWQREHLRSRGNTIEAGTSEILRSIVAERVLGLPRSR